MHPKRKDPSFIAPIALMAFTTIIMVAIIVAGAELMSTVLSALETLSAYTA